ncbi:MAG: hypothetical protein AAF722_18510 [Cyanobacteria bacterium P01_C01_bin.70]
MGVPPLVKRITNRTVFEFVLALANRASIPAQLSLCLGGSASPERLYYLGHNLSSRGPF